MAGVRLSKTQRNRLQQMLRPGYISTPTGNPTITDQSLADRGLIVFRDPYNRPGYVTPQITDEGRVAVQPDDYEHCGCGSLSHRQEAACISCGAPKEWAA